MTSKREQGYIRQYMAESVTTGRHTLVAIGPVHQYSLDSVCALCGSNPLLMNFRATCIMVLEGKVENFRQQVLALGGENLGST